MDYCNMALKIPASPIRDMMVRAAAMEDVISFTVGEPDFNPTESIIDAAKAALDQRDTRYAPGAGLTELREVYAQYLSAQVGIPYGVENVVVTTGGMSSLFLSLLCTVNPGDEVLMLNSPCNPTGGVISKESLKEIAEIAVEHDLFVLSDEVYRHILFDGEEYASIVTEPGMRERTLIIDSCSKTFAMTGFRIGFGAGPAKWVSLMTKLTEGIYSSTPTIGQRAAIEAFKSGLPYCKEMVKQYEKRRNYLYERLNRMKGISCIKPKGAFYIFVNISGTGLDAAEFSSRLLDEAHVAVVPGGNFGSKDGDKYVRMVYATSMENIKEGCDRMERFCSSL